MQSTKAALGCGDHLLSTQQLDRTSLEQIFNLAAQLEPVARGEAVCNPLEGAVLANLFFEPSTRSRISFGSAFSRLGGRVLDTTGTGTTSLAKGESLEDTARVVSGYADVMVLRHPAANAVRTFASGSLRPVINGGDGAGEHPTQSLTDLYTMHKELASLGRGLDSATVSMIGDLRFGRTVHSLVMALAAYRSVRIKLLSPRGLEMRDDYSTYAQNHGICISEVQDLKEALEDADVVYMTRYQAERYKSDATLPAENQFIRLNAQSLGAWARPEVIVMHPLPRDSQVGELSTDLDDFPNLAIFRQTDNGVPVRMALFCLLLGIEERAISASMRQPLWVRKASTPLNSFG